MSPIADASESGVTRLRNRDLGPFAVTYCPFRLPGGPAPPCNRQRPFFACGYALANAGHDTRALQAWLGHRNIQHTVRYTELAPDRFRDFWRS